MSARWWRSAPTRDGVKVGDKRLVYPWIGCGACAVCKRGDEQLCMAPRFLGVYRDGGYADASAGAASALSRGLSAAG